MTSESEPIRENNQAADAGRESDVQASNTKPNIPPTPSATTLPPTKPHCEITCKTEKDWWDKWKPFVEIIGIALLAVYTGYTIKMYYANKEAAEAAKSAAATADATLKEIQKGGTDTHDLAVAAGKQAAAAKSAAENAKQSLQTTIETFHLDQRAWVAVSRFLLSNEPEADKEIKVDFWLVNTGKTPAKDEVLQSALFVAPHRPPMTKFVIPKISMSRFILTPGTTNQFGSTDSWKVPEPNLGQYLKKSQFLYFHAILRYTDVFQKDHWTTVCAIHTYGRPLDEFIYCEEGNAMDSDEPHHGQANK